MTTTGSINAKDSNATTSSAADGSGTDGNQQQRQLAGHMRRMLNERANAVAYGDTDRVKRMDRDLAEAGFTGDPAAFSDGDAAAVPVGRTSGRSDVTSPVVTAPAPAPAPATAPAAAPNKATTAT